MNHEQLARLPEVLFEIGKAIGSDEDLGVLLSRISELVCDIVDAEACSVMLLDTEGEVLLPKAAYGLRPERIQTISFRVGEGVAGWVVQNVEAALIDDVAADPRFLLLETSRTVIRSLACVPLVARGECIGCMTATSGRVGAFGGNAIEMLRFVAKTIALDIENIRLHRLSVTDPLTGAFNREFLGRRLPVEIASAVQRGEPLSVAMVDVDHFKSVNDRFGHEVGDSVLAEVAQRLRGAIRKDDLLVRYGGEEFLVVLPRGDARAAWEVGERMRLKMQEAAMTAPESAHAGAGSGAIEVRISVGVAELKVREGEAVESAGDLIRRADTALYAAKGRGRNRVEVAS